LVRFAWLSVGTALVTMAMKAAAYLVTDSVGLLSDALESTVNLVAALGAVVALTVAARPPDDGHAFGHTKAEYFSALAEGTMILVAAGAIVWAAIGRLLDPRALEDIGVGLAVSLAASGLNLAVAIALRRAGRANRSIALEADGTHLLTDVWTSAGVVVGVAAVGITGVEVLDPLVAIAVAVNIVVSGVRLVTRSTQGLMDVALPDDDLRRVEAVLSAHTGPETRFHGLRTRQSGHRSFLTVHVLVPGAWSVQRSHDLVEVVEADLRAAVADLNVTTHVEPLEDPRSFADEGLDRTDVPPSGTGRPDPAV
jgi:cation diffusion facilitator family transporter